MQSSTLQRGLNTMDHPAVSAASSSRAASRTRRRMRFRLTALPSAFGVVKPSALRPLSAPGGSARQKAANKGHEYRTPWSYTLRKSLDRRSRTLLGKPNGDSPGFPATGPSAKPGPPDMQSFGTGLPLRADGQLLAALRAAARQHGAAIGGLHAFPKTVRLGAVTVVRLISTFRHCSREN